MNIAWSDAALAALFWLLTFYLFRPSALRKERWSDRRAFGPRLLVLALAVSLSFQIDPLAAEFDALVGINNLSWLLAYGNAAVAAYAGLIAMVAMGKRPFPRWLNVVTLAILAAFLLLVPILASNPEEMHSRLPQSSALLIYRELLYVFLSVMTIFGMSIHREWLENEEFVTGKFRGGVLLAALSSGLAFFVLRGIASLFVYFNPDTPFYKPLLFTSNILVAAAICGLALAFGPRAIFQTPIRWVSYLQQLWALRDLEQLRNQLVAITGELPWPPPSRRDRWFNPPYALYCTLIDILDRLNLLRARMVRNDPKITPLHRRIAAAFDELPNTGDWVELVQHLRQVGREL